MDYIYMTVMLLVSLVFGYVINAILDKKIDANKSHSDVE